MKMSNPKRLHPVAAVILFIKQLKELLIPFIAFVIFGSRGSSWDWFYLVASIGSVIILLIIGVVSWVRYTYRLEEGEIRIEYGVFIRKKRYIPFERIQSIDISEGIIQRVFGLVKVKIETAGSSSSSEAEAELTAITKEEANFIQQLIESDKQQLGDHESEREEHLPIDKVYSITTQQLLLLASTSGGVGVVISAMMAFVFQFDEIIPYEKVVKDLEQFVQNSVVIISAFVFVGFLIAWLIAIVGSMFKYANFTVVKKDDDIIIKRGLLERTQLTIPLQRVQAIRVVENVLRQPLGYATIFIEIAGGGDADGRSKVMLFPVIKKVDMISFLSKILKDYEFDVNLTKIPKRSIRRYLFRAILPTIPIILIAIVFFHWWGTLTLLLVPLFIGVGYWQYVDSRYNADFDQLTVQSRFIVRQTLFMRKNRIQSILMNKSYFQAKNQLVSLSATVKSGAGGSNGTIIDLDESEGRRIYAWYSMSEQREKSAVE